jgi:metacaspase-1
MTKGISLHVGVNATKIGGTSLVGCVNDATEMALIAEKHQFEGREVVPDCKATFDYVTGKIKEAATQLGPGDIFFFTFSGHGSFIPDEDDDEHDPDDDRDETLVLFDFMICDDYFARELWPRFAEGVRILMIADSCHSGTIASIVEGGNSPTSKALSDADRIEHLAHNSQFYEDNCKKLVAKPIVASVLQIGACDDNDTTADGSPNSAFTQKLLDVIRGTTPPDTYRKLVADVAALLIATQVPQLTQVGIGDPAFVAQMPFTIK